MIFSDLQMQDKIVFFSINPPPWSDVLQAHLHSVGFQLNLVDSVDRGIEIITPGSVDFVIAVDSSESQTLFEKLRNRTETADSPIRVLICEDNSALLDERTINLAHLILPPHPVYIERQLQSFIALRVENAQLKAQKTGLEKSLKDLRDDLLNQRRTSSEIEVIKNAIVRNVSHELKTPLLQVKSAVALIAEDSKDDRLIQYAMNATARLETLVRNITMLGSSLDINLGPVIVRDAVEYARRNLSRNWLHKNEADRIQVNVEENLPPVMADKQGLSTVLQLLLDNALKFSEGRVELMAKRQGEKIHLHVRDYGIGIAKDKLSTIFDTFYQVDSSSTRRYGGMGVGLALVKLILDHHDVTISVESEEGKGSTFSFSLEIVQL